ncbi:hypothetical protein [Pedobacter namyangjuensis]|uniref:hypothetical protein n=1 Tax=Pedobacter namyangjuensis TaxID=600626 RepID=UPI000DE2BE4C|nr:hypothetical protein [Pedobacter namyangjuensis]
MLTKKSIITLTVILSSGWNFLFAQNLDRDSLAKLSYNNALSFYRVSLNENVRFVNGETYYSYGTNVGGSAVFGDSTFVNGTLVYEGLTYIEIPLMYDLYIDKLVSVTNTGAFSIVSEKIDQFRMGSHSFINLESIVLDKKNVSGFFEVKYKGKLGVYVKHRRELKFSLNKETPYYFNPKKLLYVEMNNNLHEVSNESSLLNIFSNKKKEVIQYVRENGLKFKQDPEKFTVEVVKYYERLIL